MTFKCSVPLVLFVVTAALVSGGCKSSPSRAQHPSPPSDYAPPQRITRSGDTTAPPPPPELPQGADELPEITVKLNLAHGELRVVSRTKNRVHLAMPDRNQEWLFIRNPVDPRRVSGILIDHNHKVRIDYPESDLRIEGVARGWADIIAIDESKGEVTRGVDQKLIADPHERFPEYGDFDIADWREELHENGHDHAGHHSSTEPTPTEPKPAEPRTR